MNWLFQQSFVVFDNLYTSLINFAHPSGRKGHARGPVRKWNSSSGKKYFFLVKMGFSLPNWLFQQSFVVFDNLYTSLINLKRDNLLILARREF
jgi:hypothetical protein